MRVSPPLRYSLANEVPPPGPYIEIQPEYRLPGEQVYNVRSLPQQKRVELTDRIHRWLSANDLTWETFTVHDRSTKSQMRAADSNALARLLAAQSADIREKILIPGDIALLLMSRS
jgi:hypothetical protein